MSAMDAISLIRQMRADSHTEVEIEMAVSEQFGADAYDTAVNELAAEAPTAARGTESVGRFTPMEEAPL